MGCGATVEVKVPEPVKVPFALKAKLTKEQKAEARAKRVAEAQAVQKQDVDIADEDCIMDEKLMLDPELQKRLQTLLLELLCVAKGGLMATEICKFFQSNGAANYSSARALWNNVKNDLVGAEQDANGACFLNEKSREEHTVTHGVSGAKATEVHSRFVKVLLEVADPAGDRSWSLRFQQRDDPVAVWSHVMKWLPYHLTCAGMKEELTTHLTDIVFLEEKCRLDVLGLLADYLDARKLGIGTEFGSPVHDFFRLFRDNVDELLTYPENVFQLAYNYAPSTTPCLKAHRLLTDIKSRRCIRAGDSRLTREWAIRWAGPDARCTSVATLGHTEPVDQAIYSPNNELIVTAHGAMCFLWSVHDLLNVRTFQKTPVKSWHCGAVIACLAFSLDSRLIFTGGADGKIRIWESDSGNLDQSGQNKLVHGKPKSKAEEAKEAEKQKRKLTKEKYKQSKADSRGKSKAWFTGDKAKEVAVETQETKGFFSGKIAGKAATLASIRRDSVRIGAPLLILPDGPDMQINAVTIGSKLFVSAGDDRMICLWHPITRVLIGCLAGHTAAVTCVEFDLNEDLIASGSNDLSIRYWSVDIAVAREDQRKSEQVLEDTHEVVATTKAKLVDLESGQAQSEQTLQEAEARLKEADTMDLVQADKNKKRKVEDQSLCLSMRVKLKAFAQSIEDCEFEIINAEDTLDMAQQDLVEKTATTQAGLEGGSFREMVVIAHAHKKRINVLVFSSDGIAMASCSEDNTIKLWSVETQTVTATLDSVHTSNITSVQFNNDGSQLISSSNDKRVMIWDIEIFVVIRTLTGHSERINRAQLSNDNKYILTCSNDMTAQIWDSTLNPEVVPPERSISRRNYEQYKEKIRARNSRLRAKLIAKYIQVEDGETDFTDYGDTGGHSGPVLHLSFACSGDMLASCSTDSTVKIWNTAGNQIRQTFKGHTDQVNCVAWTPDETRVVSGSSDNSLRIWDILPNLCRCIMVGHEGKINAVAVNDGGVGGRVIASGSDDCSLRIWHMQSVLDETNGLPEAKTNLFKHEFWHKGPVTCLDFSPDGKSLASGSEDFSVKFWNYKKGVEIMHLEVPGYQEPVTALAFRPDGESLASALMDRTIKFWNTNCGQDKASLGDVYQTIKHSKPITSLAFTVDTTELVSTSEDKTIICWDVAGEEGKRVIKGNFAPFSTVTFHPRDEGIMVVACGSEIFTMTRTKDTSTPNCNSYFRDDHDKKPALK